MQQLFSEIGREFRRNMKGITNHYFVEPYRYDDDYDALPDFIIAFTPLIYLVGAVEPVFEAPIRVAIKKYPVV